MLKRCITVMLITFFSVNSLYCIANTFTENYLNSIPVSTEISSTISTEHRGYPTYDFIVGKDFLPHFRVFFWIDKDAKRYIPYADVGIKTDVSEHGSVDKWSVIETNQTKGDEKLVFIFVPKTFVLLEGKGFQNKIHLKYESC